MNDEDIDNYADDKTAYAPKNNAKVVRFLVLLSTIKYYDTIKCY